MQSNSRDTFDDEADGSRTTIVYKQSSRFKSLLIIPFVALASIALRNNIILDGAITPTGALVLILALLLILVALKMTFGAAALVLTSNTLCQKSPLISWTLPWSEIISTGEFRLGSTPSGGVECLGLKILKPRKANWFLRMIARKRGYDLYVVDCWEEKFAFVVEEIKTRISASKSN